jgi:hypothetical protein
MHILKDKETILEYNYTFHYLIHLLQFKKKNDEN